MIDNVEELLNKHNIEYVDKGDYVQCLCLNPCHDDTHIGSFSIRKSDGLSHCFACGFATNLIGLNKMLGESLTAIPTIKFNNFKTKKQKISKKEKPIVVGSLKDVNTNGQVYSFLDSIGFTEKFIKQYDVKYVDYAEMISQDLYGNPKVSYTTMSNRIVIPIFHNGKLINYECRTFVNDTPKVKYVRGCSTQTLFNFDNIDKHKMVIITESIKNLAKIWQVYPNVVSMFHNILSSEQIPMVNELDNICLFLDNDGGGMGCETDSGFRKGMLQSFIENYKKPFKICYNSKVKKSYDSDNNLVIKGYDANDSSLNEIRNLIANAIPYNDYLKQNRKVTW